MDNSLTAGDNIWAEKRFVRRAVLAARAVAVPPDEALVASRVLGLAELRGTTTVAAYRSMPGEQPTGQVIDRLLAAGVTVLLPVLLDDDDLDWASAEGPLSPGRCGLSEPTGQRLGPAALSRADAVLVPAVAVDRQGRRLGRGGGSYDRALGRARPGVPLIALVADAEVLERVPATAHDWSVTVVVTPTRVLRTAHAAR